MELQKCTICNIESTDAVFLEGSAGYNAERAENIELYKVRMES